MTTLATDLVLPVLATYDGLLYWGTDTPGPITEGDAQVADEHERSSGGSGEPRNSTAERANGVGLARTAARCPWRRRRGRVAPGPVRRYSHVPSRRPTVNRPSRQTTGLLLTIALVGALAACNAIVGIEDVHFVEGVDATGYPDSGKPKRDATSDATTQPSKDATKQDTRPGHDSTASSKDAGVDRTASWTIVTLVDGGYLGGSNSPCGIATDGTYVYWTDFAHDAVMKVSQKGGVPVTVIKNATGVCAIALYGKDIFYGAADTPADAGFAVWKVAGGQGGSTPISSELDENIQHMATDGMNVYWTSPALVQMVPTDGGDAVTIAVGSNPMGIAAYGGYYYWTDFGDGGNGSVDRVYLGFSTVAAIATGQAGPLGIATDSTNLYWVDEGSGHVMRLPLHSSALDGSTLATLAVDDGGPYAVAVDDSSVYWTDDVNDASILRVGLDGGPVTTIAEHQNRPILAATGTTVYWATSDGRIMKATHE